MKNTFKSLCIAAVLCMSSTAYAQLTLPASGGNKKASVSERIGITDVSINYNRPGVKGREGKVWGELVHEGFIDLGFGTSKAAPWRAGANENTVVTFTTPVKIEGKDLPAGSYGFFVAMGKDEATLIFSKNYTSWGSYYYSEAEDALRVTVKTQKVETSKEWLEFNFVAQTDNSAIINLSWEKLIIPFKVEVDVVNTTIASLRQELRGQKGLTSQALVDAAAYCSRNNANLQEALTWADYAINDSYLGRKTYASLSTKADILKKLGKAAEADALMKDALPLGDPLEIHFYGRSLLSEKRAKEALEVFKFNAEKNKYAYPTNMGLARGYSGVGDYKNALKYAKAALEQTTSPYEKEAVQGMIKLLQENKDINQ